MRSNEDLDASGDAWLAANEAVSFERHDHLVDRGRADLKVALHIGLGGRVSKHVRVGVDESQVLASRVITPFLHHAREGADGQAVVCPLLRGS